MELLNATKLQAGYTLGARPDGRELLVVAVKGTFKIPEDEKEPPLAEEQVPLIEADVFTGEPGFSAPLYESDYPPHKPRCDLILNGSAYAPGGKPTNRVRVSLQVGSFSKSFDVVGTRVWKKRLFSIRASKPKPFAVMPISYNNAFGGVDKTHKKEKQHRVYLSNHVGIGFHSNLKAEFLDNTPLPNTEESGRPVTKPRGKYRPMAFGPIARSAPPRLKYAGTYDDNWLAEGFPFLPADFNDAYYQSAPLDQQIDYLRGGEEVVLRNLSRYGHKRFMLPHIVVPIVFFFKNGKTHKTNGVADTLVIEPDKARLMITWRANVPLMKNIFELTRVLTGEMPPGWWRARELGKTYYKSLKEMVREKHYHRDIERE